MGNVLSYTTQRLRKPFDSINQTPMFQRYQKYHECKGDGYSVIAGICVTINVLMGSGFLALPRLIEASGIILGPLVMLIACLILRTTGLFEAELMCRAEAIVKGRLQPLRIKAMQRNPEDSMQIQQHSFSMVELCEIFSGKWLQNLYIGLVTFYLFFTLVGYAVVFSSAMSNYVPVPFIYQGRTCKYAEEQEGCYVLQNFYIIMFGILAIPLSLIGVKEQVSFQILMTCMRILVAFLMTGTCAYAIATGSQVFGPSFGIDEEHDLFTISQLYAILPVSFFAQNINAYVSLVVQDMKDKSSLNLVVTTGMVVTCCFYGFIGCTVAYYFGDNITPTANVMWEYFTGGYESLPLWVQFVSIFVLLFPAMDVVSIYPLNSITMASNAMAGFYHDRIDKAEKDNFILRFFRSLCAVPPLLCALLVGNRLDVVLMYAGSCAIPLSMIIPPYLNFVSQRMVKQELGFQTAKTPFTGFFSNPKLLLGISVVGSVRFAIILTMCTIDVLRG